MPVVWSEGLGDPQKPTQILKEIKQLQHQIKKLNVAKVIEESRAEYLGARKTLDNLVLKQEIF